MAPDKRETIGERIASVLATYVGPSSARIAVETVARRAVHRPSSALTLAYPTTVDKTNPYDPGTAPGAA